MLEVIEEKMKQDDETTATQLMKVVEAQGWRSLRAQLREQGRQVRAGASG